MSESWQEFAKRQSDYAVKLERQLTIAERERDEAREQLRLANADAAMALAECDTLRHRAERAERVVEAARAWYDVQDEIAEGREPMSAFRRCELTLVAAVRALDEAEGTP